MSEGFGKAHSQLSSALTKSKEAISKVFGVGKELTK